MIEFALTVAAALFLAYLVFYGILILVAIAGWWLDL